MTPDLTTMLDEAERLCSSTQGEYRVLCPMFQKMLPKVIAACRSLQSQRDDTYAYAEALQNLYDNGGPMIEPALARRVDEMRDKCRDSIHVPD